MKRNVESRLLQLEKQHGGTRIAPMTLVVSQFGKELNLETSKCKRTLSRNGLLTQIVELDGSREGFTNEQLEAWIERFPIEGPQ